MNKISIVELLKHIEIFKGIDSALLNQIGNTLQNNTFSRGTPIIHKGEEGDSMFIISSGKVKIHDGEHIVALMEAGNFFGEFSLLDAAPRSMSVTALEDVETISINREIFYNLLKNQPEVAQKIISTLTTRLRGQNESIINQLKTRESELTRLVNERTHELKIKNEEITIKNREITDNLNYAKRIQSAILPDLNTIYKTFPQSFVLYLPKDIVSGDFFSFFIKNNCAIVIAADCTGHGVTGAFLSVIGSSLLNQVIHKNEIPNPGNILDLLHEEMITALNQRNNESTDGMDVSICLVDFEKQLLRYAGANRPMWLIRKGEMIIYPPNKFPIGGLQIFHNENFSNHEITLQKNDTFYIFTDGFADQFGGINDKKLLTKKLKEILLAIQHLDMINQKDYLNDFFQNWKGSNEQVDDVLVIGVRV